MNTFQQKEDKVKFKLFETCMKKLNAAFLYREVSDLKSRQNKIIKDLQLRRKP